VVTEFNDTQAMRAAAKRAAHEFGYTRMWSIHPAQIRPILEAMAPDAAEIDVASEIVLAARAAQWAPISHKGQLHDRASYRFFWQVLARAHSTGCSLPAEVQLFFGD
jgi:citrate lyase subunit beta/citryl-CoA lyase